MVAGFSEGFPERFARRCLSDIAVVRNHTRFSVLARASENLVLVSVGDEQPVVVRVTPPGHRGLQELRGELEWLLHLERAGVRAVRLLSPALVGPCDTGDGVVLGTLFRWVGGCRLDGQGLTEHLLVEIGRLLASIHRATTSFVLPADTGRKHWYDTANYDVERWAGDLPAPTRHRLLDVIDGRRGTDERVMLVHGDLGLANIHDWDGHLYALDFDDACMAPASYDVAASVFDIVEDHPDLVSMPAVDVIDRVLAGYTSIVEAPGFNGPRILEWWPVLSIERSLSSRRLGGDRQLADRRLRRLVP